ncbi:MAG: hypothetical protein ACR2OO_08950 [Thermomicrobiales bacterium]
MTAKLVASTKENSLFVAAKNDARRDLIFHFDSDHLRWPLIDGFQERGSHMTSDTVDEQAICFGDDEIGRHQRPSLTAEDGKRGPHGIVPTVVPVREREER